MNYSFVDIAVGTMPTRNQIVAVRLAIRVILIGVLVSAFSIGGCSGVS
jgi:hypothetical protein